MSKYEVSGACGRRILKRLLLADGAPLYSDLLAACKEEDGSPRFAEQWMKWALFLDPEEPGAASAKRAALCAGMDCATLYRSIRSSTRVLAGAMSTLFYEAGCTPWVESDE